MNPLWAIAIAMLTYRICEIDWIGLRIEWGLRFATRFNKVRLSFAIALGKFAQRFTILAPWALRFMASANSATQVHLAYAEVALIDLAERRRR